MGDRIVSWKKRVAAQFGLRWLEMKGKSWWFYTHRRRMKVVKMLLDGRGLILDVGSGDGEMLADLVSEDGYYGVGIDFSKLLVKASRNLVRGRNLSDLISIVRGDAETLPFRDCSFDAVYSSATIEHLPRPATCIAEMGRVTKHLKRLVIVTPNPIYGMLEKVLSYFRHRTITSKFLANALRRNNFRVIYLDCFLLYIPFSYHFLEKFEQRLPRTLRIIVLADVAVAGVKNT